MSDVKHCGGTSALVEIARVAPHNPSDLVALVASAHAAAMPQMRFLEYAWGKVPWRGDLTTPAERIVDGQFILPTTPGLGISLNEETVAAHSDMRLGF